MTLNPKFKSALLGLIALSYPMDTAKADDPMLPAGLMGVPNPSREPAMQPSHASEDWREALPFELTGFIETRVGSRLQSDDDQKQLSIGEARLHLQASKSWDALTLNLTSDLLYDPIASDHAVDLETGSGWFDLREANLVTQPFAFMDAKWGRQILTWGTGDFLFINDMFPKDWNSFFIGREDEYLKAPSDALKLGLFSKLINLDIVYTPRFDADRYIDGRRISFYNASAGKITGRSAPLITDTPNDYFSDAELALRAHRLIGPFEVALYYYDGFWKSPNGQNPSTGAFTFPELSVYGASLRGPLASGIANIEVGYYGSREDQSGSNPFVANSEWKLMAGYEQELARDLTGSIQVK